MKVKLILEGDETLSDADGTHAVCVTTEDGEIKRAAAYSDVSELKGILESRDLEEVVEIEREGG